MTPIRLLWLLDSLGAGGAEALVLPFSRNLDRTRFALTVAALRSGGENSVESTLRAEGVPLFIADARNYRDRAAFRRLRRFVEEERFELVHGHLAEAAIWSAALTRNTVIPSIASLHVSPAATRALFPGLRFRIWSWARERVMTFMVNRWSSAVVVVSEGLRREYVPPLRRSKVRVVHNGIDIARFQRPREETRARLQKEFAIAPGSSIAATVCVLRPLKGIEVLLEAARAIPGTTFLIIGHGPEEPRLRALARTLGVEERVRWAGFRNDVESLLAGCDLLIHPTLSDAFPTVLLEAMAAGLAVVASEVGGIPEIVTEETGVLVPPGEPAALAVAVSSIATDTERRARMGRAAAGRAAERFSTTAWLARLSEVYAEALTTKAQLTDAR